MELKDKVIIGLGLLCLVLGYFAFKNPKVITKVVEKIVEKVVTKTEIKYITSNSTITGGTTATVLPSGGTAVSGANLTITNTTTTTTMETTTMTVKEKEIVKERYTESNINFGGAITSTLDYGLKVGIKIDDITLSGIYLTKRNEYIIDGAISVLKW